MKPNLLIVIVALILAVIGGGIYYFINQSPKAIKTAVKEKKDIDADIPVPVKEEIKNEVVKSPSKNGTKTTVSNISSKPFELFELNVHLHDFDEDFVCTESMGEIYSCGSPDKEKNLKLQISLTKSIPNGTFSVSENSMVIIEGNYINGFINGEVTKSFPNGVVDTVENYKNGLLDGGRIVYSKDSQRDSGSVLRQEQQWTAGFPDGIFVRNGFDGNLIRKVKFTNGQFEGEI
jgi:hypothetical protein